MDIYGPGVNYDQVHDIIETVGDIFYDGNVIVHPDAYDYRGNGHSFRGRITVIDNRGPGSRTSWTGRHGPYACWHAYRDVMAMVLSFAPDATIATAMARYRGLQGFKDLYPGTAGRNIGSMAAPAYMPDLCQCTYPVRHNDEV